MSLPKQQRLKSRTAINTLFEKRNSFHRRNLKVYYNFTRLEGQKHPILFTASVPKKSIKTAVDRNLLKRRIRESFIKNQSLILLEENKEKQLHLLIVYTSKTILDFDVINEDMIYLLNKIR